MDLIQKKKELINLIVDYLNNQASSEKLQEFSWNMIEYFSKTKKTQLPAYQEFEKEFWYAIWQIQHLADEEHENEGLTGKILSDALGYLQKKQEIPESFLGLRP